jgi:hypothetical protein
MLEEEHFSFYSLSSQLRCRRIKYIATLHDYLISMKNPASVLGKVYFTNHYMVLCMSTSKKYFDLCKT